MPTPGNGHIHAYFSSSLEKTSFPHSNFADHSHYYPTQPLYPTLKNPQASRSFDSLRSHSFGKLTSPGHYLGLKLRKIPHFNFTCHYHVLTFATVSHERKLDKSPCFQDTVIPFIDGARKGHSNALITTCIKFENCAPILSAPTSPINFHILQNSCTAAGIIRRSHISHSLLCQMNWEEKLHQSEITPD